MISPGSIPRALRDLDQWVVWRTEVRDDKPTKVPYSVRGSKARANDRRTWSSFSEAVQASGDGYDGIGFMFSVDDPYCGIDLDDVRDPDTGEIHEAALAIIDALDSYVEVSPSATGAKIIVKAELPTIPNRKSTGRRTNKTPWRGDIEMYDRERYFALTGESIGPGEVNERHEQVAALYEEMFGEVKKDSGDRSVPANGGTAPVAEDDAEVLDRAMNHSHFRRLWEGDTSKYGGDESVADLAFCATLARITDDRDQVLRLWLASGLKRDKTEREDYVQRTLDKAYLDVRPSFEALNELNDSGNAKRIVAEHGHELRYTSGLGWLTWDGMRWKVDSTGAASRFAEDSARRLFLGVDDLDIHDDRAKAGLKRFAKNSMNASKIKSALEVTAWQREVRRADDELDVQAYRLNVINGTLDLRTLALADHDREDHITRIAPVEYDPAASSAVWDSFVERILPDDDLRSFVQRVAGYTIAGSPIEKYLMFAHGPRDTGKSTFLNAFADVLGDYAQTADFETFIAKKGGHGTRNDLARMKGARLIKSSEVDDGEKIAAGVVKELTGGDTIAARFLYKEHIEFKIEGVLWLAANARPKVDAGDDAMWRRILHVPFLESIPVEEQDRTLGSKLQRPEERRAILKWLVDGFTSYAERGIDPPSIVTEYGDEYRHEMNPLADFFESWARVSGDERDFEPWQAIRDHVQRWADHDRVRCPSDPELKTALRAAGCVGNQRGYSNGAQVRGWTHITLIDPEAIPHE